MADRLRRELDRLSSSYTQTSAGNGVTCTTECQYSSGSGGRTQAELDALAQEMTNQIMIDLRSGKLHRGQINSPNWFEHRVADKLSELHQQHHPQFQQNHFHQNFNQHFGVQTQQQQQQNNQFQQQSQSQQQSFGYIRPITTGNSYQRVVEEHHKVSGNTAFPTPVTVYHGATISHRNNCTDQIHQGTFPYFNVQNQFNQRVDSNRQISSVPTFITPVTGGSSYHVSQQYEHKEHRTPQVQIVVPTQNTYQHEFREEQRQTHRQQPRPQFYGINQQKHNSHVETSKVHNVQIITPAPTQTITRQDVHNEFYESEVVPNYQPRITIDKNTQFHELEVRNRQEYRPIIPQVTSRTHIEKEEQHIDRQYHQTPIIQPQITTNVVRNEEYEINRQHHQKPIIQPQITTNVIQNEEYEINSQHHQKPVIQPQITTNIIENEDYGVNHQVTQRPITYPTYSHTTNVQSFNESRNTQNTQTIYQQPGSNTITTVEETHYSRVLPQPATQHTIYYTGEEYSERLNRIQQELRRLGYGILTEEEYNSTISSGGFIHNGWRYLYVPEHGRYEKIEKVEITEEDYNTLLRCLQTQLNQLGVQFSERDYNQTIQNGFFEVNGIRYIYDSESGDYYRQEISDEKYEILRQRLQEASNQYGWRLTTNEINQTIATGDLTINGYHYVLNKQTGELIQTHQIKISEQEYRTILRHLQEQLDRLGLEQMTESEYNETIQLGYFVRNGQKYQYNYTYGRYELVEFTEEEYNEILGKLKFALKEMKYRQMSDREINETIATGTFIRGGYLFKYDIKTGQKSSIRNVGKFDELSAGEYESIYEHLQELLRRLGYPAMSQIEAEDSIVSGSFHRGGNEWVYQPASAEFERIELTDNEYSFRAGRLSEILKQLGIEKEENEYREIIFRGNFYHGGQRYEFDATSGTFVLAQMTNEEYQERKRQLLQQLREIGFGTMTDSQCRSTINNGVFYFAGHEWIYNYVHRRYEVGRETSKENGIVDDNYFDNIQYDRTEYGTSKPNNDTASNGNKNDNGKNKRPIEIISKNRGDQPPQTFGMDYDEETTEKRPPPPRPTVRPTYAPRPIPYTTALPVLSTVSSGYNHHVVQSQQITYAVPPPETEVEQSFHHKKTTITQSAGFVSKAKEIVNLLFEND